MVVKMLVSVFIPFSMELLKGRTVPSSTFPVEQSSWGHVSNPLLPRLTLVCGDPL